MNKKKSAPTDQEHHAYLSRVASASKRVQEVYKAHPEFDLHDLFRIALLRDESNESKLSGGLRRRVIGYV